MKRKRKEKPILQVLLIAALALNTTLSFVVLANRNRMAQPTEKKEPVPAPAVIMLEGATVEGLVAIADGRTVGYAFFFPNFASFRGQRGFYLEDIYVTESCRGKRVGESMLRELARLSRPSDVARRSLKRPESRTNQPIQDTSQVWCSQGL